MTLPIPRFLLEKYFGNDPRMLLAMEQHTQSTVDNVAATKALKDATVIVLSPNDDFDNARVLDIGGDGIEADVTDATITLRVRDVARTENFTVTLLPTDNSVLNLPAATGTLIGTINALAVLGNYANDAAAQGAGVPIGGLYRTGSAVMIRSA